MLKTFVTIGVLQLLTMVFQLVRTKLLAVMLGPDSIGVMAVIDKLLAVVSQTASLSLPFAAVRFLPEYWRNDPDQFDAVYRAMRRLLLACAGAATVIALGVTVFAPHLWGESLRPYGRVIAVAVLTIPALMLVPFIQNVVAAQMRQNQAMVIAVTNAAVLTVSAVLGAWLGGLVGNYALFAVLGLGLTIVAVRISKAVPRGKPEALTDAVSTDARALPRRSLPPMLWRFSAAMLALAFLTPYAALFVHYRVLSRLGPEVAGWMQATLGVSIAVRTVLGSAHAVFLTPGVNRGGTPSERMAWASEFQSTLCLLAAVSVPLLLLFPQVAVRVLYTAQFAPGARFVALFVFAELLGLLAATYQAIVVAFDHLVFHVVQNITAQLLLVAIAAPLIDSHGILGAGIAGLSAQALLYIATTTFLRWRYRIKVPARTAALTAFALTACVATGVAGVMWPALSLPTIALKLLGYVLIIGLLFAVLSPDDRQRLLRIAGRLRPRLQPANS